MRQNRYITQRLRERQFDELAEYLKSPDLNRSMVESIMDATVDGAVDAYANSDEHTGDKFARLNGYAFRLLQEVPEQSVTPLQTP